MTIPVPVKTAISFLYAWTGWTSIYGVAEIAFSAPQISGAITEVAQGAVIVAPWMLIAGAIMAYGLLAWSCIAAIRALARGRNWVRISLVVCVALKVLMLVVPGQALLDYIAALPDLGLLGYAAYLLYTPQAAPLFTKPAKQQ